MKSAGTSILVVEDEDEWNEIIRLWLKTAGYTDVRYATSGKQAFRMLKKEVPDCVLMDLQLSDQDGTILIRKIRETEEMANVPIILMTNYGGERVTGLKAGADYFIAKNANGEELLATLEALFRRRDIDHNLKRRGDLAFQPEQYQVYLQGKLVATLTPKTYDLLRILVDRSPSPVPREELFKMVENREDPSLSRALDILMNRLRKSIPEALRRRIKSVRGFGYAYIPPPVKSK